MLSVLFIVVAVVMLINMITTYAEAETRVEEILGIVMHLAMIVLSIIAASVGGEFAFVLGIVWASFFGIAMLTRAMSGNYLTTVYDLTILAMMTLFIGAVYSRLLV